MSIAGIASCNALFARPLHRQDRYESCGFRFCVFKCDEVPTGKCYSFNYYGRKQPASSPGWRRTVASVPTAVVRATSC